MYTVSYFCFILTKMQIVDKFHQRSQIQKVMKICAVDIMLFQSRQVDGHVSQGQQSLFVL